MENIKLNDLVFKEIERTDDEVKDLILNYHYAKRIPSISYLYGAYYGDELVGCITFGKPPSPNLCVGVCGKEHKDRVYELNRLIFKYEIKNAPSKFLGYALRDIKKHNLILVSFADNNMNHHGYIYQATNWIYTGLSAKRTDTYSPKGVHARHVPKDVSEKTKHLRVLRSRKHRYIYFAMEDKRNKKFLLNKLKYPIQEYPKGNNQKYVLGEEYNGRWIRNNLTGEEYYEK